MKPYNEAESYHREAERQAWLTEIEQLPEARRKAVMQAISDISATLSISQYRALLNMRRAQ